MEEHIRTKVEESEQQDVVTIKDILDDGTQHNFNVLTEE